MENELEERELKELELMNENENREFYVYEHIRLDTMTCFYIGKGTKNRAYEKYRNLHHDNICDACCYKVVIIKNNLTENQAFKLENKMIEYYVHTLGYGIDIEGYNDYDHALPHLTNRDWGGIGGKSGINPYANKTPEEMEIIRRKIGEKSKGRNPYANKTPEEMEITRRKMSEKAKGKHVGEKSGMWGKNPYANKTPEEMEIILNKKSNSMKGKTKGKNPYANKTPEEMEIIRRKMSKRVSGEKNPMFGKLSPNRSKVICITTGKIFDCIKDAGNYYNVTKNTISFCCKEKIKSAGKLNGTKLQWKYVKDYNNEFKGILINPIAE